jgi:hypothetical protein
MRETPHSWSAQRTSCWWLAATRRAKLAPVRGSNRTVGLTTPLQAIANARLRQDMQGMTGVHLELAPTCAGSRFPTCRRRDRAGILHSPAWCVGQGRKPMPSPSILHLGVGMFLAPHQEEGGLYIGAFLHRQDPGRVHLCELYLRWRGYRSKLYVAASILRLVLSYDQSWSVPKCLSGGATSA